MGRGGYCALADDEDANTVGRYRVLAHGDGCGFQLRSGDAAAPTRDYEDSGSLQGDASVLELRMVRIKDQSDLVGCRADSGGRGGGSSDHVVTVSSAAALSQAVFPRRRSCAPAPGTPCAPPTSPAANLFRDHVPV
jgi:hypothetical protein